MQGVVKYLHAADLRVFRDVCLQLYEFEACPFCRRVREAITDLDLNVEVRVAPLMPNKKMWIVSLRFV